MDAPMLQFGGHADTSSDTVMWIGQRRHPEFRDAFELCESLAAQIAYRTDLADALLRPTTKVGIVIMTQQTRTTEAFNHCEVLRQVFPRATVVRLLGAMCMPPSRSNPTLRDIAWHQASSELPALIAGHPIHSTDVGALAQPAWTVAIVSNRADDAECLIDLADDMGATAVWSRSPSRRSIRNAHSIWWDDSVIVDDSGSAWRKRIEQFDGRHCPTHVWLTNYPLRQRIAQAFRSGVTDVVPKPYRLETLAKAAIGRERGVLGIERTRSQTSSAPTRNAA